MEQRRPQLLDALVRLYAGRRTQPAPQKVAV
jgi:hypothetical protein